MATRRERERAEYERLHSIYGPKPAKKATARRRPAEDDEDDSPIIMLSGRRADSFLSSILGQSPAPAEDDDEDQDDEDAEDDDEDQDDEDDEDPQDPTPPAGNKFFRGRNRG